MKLYSACGTPFDLPDWWELLLWRFVEAELEQLTPEEESALWQYAEGVSPTHNAPTTPLP